MNWDSIKSRNYSVTVGNIGTVYDGTDEREANDAFQEYVKQSRTGYGRASYEDVILWIDGEPIREFIYPGRASSSRDHQKRAEDLLKCDRTQLVLDVAGEIFGAIKRHGLLNAEDPEALDEWVHEQGLHHHLMQLARPWTQDLEGMPYAQELDDFDGDLSDVINPS